MDKFKNRIKYYLVGFLLGVVAVAFFFGQRGCTWLPGNRVKSVIAENTIIIGDSVAALLHCFSDDSQPVFDLLNTNGNVDFGGSKTRIEQKEYKIDGPDGLSMYFKLYESLNDDAYSELIDIKSPKINCKVSLSNSNKSPLALPKRIVFQIIESHNFSYYPIIDCQLDCYSIEIDSLKTWHKSAVSIQTSNDPSLVNRVYNIITVYKGKEYAVQYEIGENRTRIKNIALASQLKNNLCNCE
ncbi:MAG: hypothetical protein R3279_06590 [Putridiphycobacter sp.]|nr:hypothetical protein [Putridiphycobacter sp.]